MQSVEDVEARARADSGRAHRFFSDHIVSVELVSDEVICIRGSLAFVKWRLMEGFLVSVCDCEKKEKETFKSQKRPLPVTLMIGS